MKKLSFQESQEMNWNAAYSYIADKLFVTKKIPSSAMPKTIKENVVLYLDESNRPVGIIFENFLVGFSAKHECQEILKFIRSQRKKEAIKIPYEERFIRPLFSALSFPTK